MKFSFTQFFSGLTEKAHHCCLFMVVLLTATHLSGQNCPPPNSNPALTIINQVTDSTAFVNWPNVSAADSFLVEYSPAGFVPGTGLTEWAVQSAITLDSLNPCVEYDVYLYSVCSGGQISAPTGPFSFMTTTPTPTCTYTFVLTDDFGDGWNGSFLSVLHNGKQTIITLNNGFSTTVEFEAISSLPICIDYSPGAFEFEVSFEIIGPNGTMLYADGPDPMTGNILNLVACDAACSAPKTWVMSDVNATNAITKWSFLPGYGGNAFIE